jgi:hypothetical protein
MIRQSVRPRLKAVGVGGSGTTFVWPSETHFAQIGLQKCAFGDRRPLTFTANVTVVSKAEWEAARRDNPEFPLKPAPNTKYGSFLWQCRIGQLIADGQDHWWRPDADTDGVDVADQLVQPITYWGLPELQKRSASESVPSLD